MKNTRWFLVLPPEGAARTVALHTAEAFEKRLGSDTVKVFDSATYYKAYSAMLRTPDDTMAVDLLNQSLAVACLDFETSYCFVSALSPVTLFTLNLLRKYSITTMHWFSEDFHKAQYWKQVLSGYDHFFAIQKGEVETTCQQMRIPFHYLSTASTLASLPFRNEERFYDVAFIGLPSSYRIGFLESFVQQGFRLCIAGSGWNQYHGILDSSIVKNTWINEEESFDLFLKSKVGLNLSFDDPSHRSDVHISPRVYDICTAGCYLFSENVPLFREAFPDVEATLFGNVSDAVSQLKAFLTGRDFSDSHLEKNREYVLNSHMYANRVDSIIATVMKQ